MHELSIAEALVEQLTEVARREGATRIVSIRLALGAMCGVDRDALEFAFPVAAEGGLAKEARLVLEEVPVSVRCWSCGEVSEPSYPLFICAACGSPKVEAISGRELKVLSMEVI